MLVTNLHPTPVPAGQMRAAMIEAARRLLEDSPTHDISSSEVCESVGVGEPVLYRHFGDKNGLLSAVIDEPFNHYIERKRSRDQGVDPVTELYACWDDYLDFAAANPALYRLMFSPTLPKVPDAAGRIFVLLTEALDRCAVVGALRIPSGEAAQMILSANTGVALSILSQPDRFGDPRLSERVRDAVFAICLTRDGHQQEDETTQG
ncbi:TetR/AcrR family transcriptional regulator [Nocardioides sp. NPDC047086]|uniref:TetR/AcrR family transcriptional regulator n=1 Tax=Nocardioides sp. NPDC047086 TaxID=3154810 RepID=UPI0033C66CE1